MKTNVKNFLKHQWFINFSIGLGSAIVALFLYSFVIQDQDARRQNANPQTKPTQVKSVYRPAKSSQTTTKEGDTVSRFVAAADKCVDGVVHIRTVQKVQVPTNPLYKFFHGPRAPQQRERKRKGIGSGVIISEDGYIVTNNHVIKNTDQIKVTLNNKKQYDAELVGTAPTSDLAVIKIDAKNLSPIEYGDHENIRVGQWVLAIGNPFNLTSSVTAGIVSAESRSLGINDEKYSIESFIQTDAALNKGSSGGALVNLKGKLIGINTAILSPTGTYSGECFAIPVNIVQKVAHDLIKYGKVQRAILGVSIRTVDGNLAEEKDIDQIRGVYVQKVMENGAAKEAGIEKGDIIIGIDDKQVKSAAHIQEIISGYNPGDEVSVTLIRDGEQKTLEVELKNIYGTTEIVKSKEVIQLLGAKFKNAPAELQDKLGIEGGVQVKDLNEGKFQEAGIKEDFIILKVNKKDISNISELKQTINQISGGVYIEGVYPNGVAAYYAFGLKNQ